MIQCLRKTTFAFSGAGTRFNHPWGGVLNWDATQGTHRSPVSAPGTFRNLRAKCRTALGVGNSRTFAIYKNGTITGLTVTVGNDTSIHDDIVNTVVVAAGDTIAIGSTPTGTPVSTIVDIAIEFEGDNDNESIYGGPITTLGTGTVYHNIYTCDSGSGGTSLAVDDSQTLWPVAGTLTRSDVRLNTAPGGVTARTFTIYKNGVAQDGAGGTPDTRVVISGASTTGTASYSLTLAPGDKVALQHVATSTPAGTLWGVGFAFTSTNDGEYAICASGQDTVSTTLATYCGQGPLNWDTTEANVAMLGNITSFMVTGFRLEQNLADNTRAYTVRVAGVDVGPSGTLGGGATTLVGSGGPATITSADTWSFKTTPGTQGRISIWGLLGQFISEDTPGPLTSSPLLRQALIFGGMVQ